MAAQIPIKNDEEANKAAMDKVIADKTREQLMGMMELGLHILD